MSESEMTIMAMKQQLTATNEPLSPEIRNLRRRIGNRQVIELPPKGMRDRVGGRFAYLGLLRFREVVTLCGLRPHHSVLEPGCGCGRNAVHIALMLDPLVGCYMGFDVSEPMIKWCKDNISSSYSNTRFDHADIYNSHFNPEGRIKDYEFQFPYRDNLFDIVFLPSVFTHMTRSGVEHYLTEIQRVLKPGGRLLLWYALLDTDNPRAEGSEFEHFVQYDDVSWTRFLDDPGDLICYDTKYVLQSLDTAGFTVHAKITGYWRRAEGDDRRPGVYDNQDLVLSTKR